MGLVRGNGITPWCPCRPALLSDQNCLRIQTDRRSSVRAALETLGLIRRTESCLVVGIILPGALLARHSRTTERIRVDSGAWASSLLNRRRGSGSKLCHIASLAAPTHSWSMDCAARRSSGSGRRPPGADPSAPARGAQTVGPGILSVLGQHHPLDRRRTAGVRLAPCVELRPPSVRKRRCCVDQECSSCTPSPGAVVDLASVVHFVPSFVPPPRWNVHGVIWSQLGADACDDLKLSPLLRVFDRPPPPNNPCQQQQAQGGPTTATLRRDVTPRVAVIVRAVGRAGAATSTSVTGRRRSAAIRPSRRRPRTTRRRSGTARRRTRATR